jgi:restriction system protein
LALAVAVASVAAVALVVAVIRWLADHWWVVVVAAVLVGLAGAG